MDEFRALTARRLEYTTTAGFSDYREQLTKLNNSVTAIMHYDDDRLTANYVSAITR